RLSPEPARRNRGARHVAHARKTPGEPLDRERDDREGNDGERGDLGAATLERARGGHSGRIVSVVLRERNVLVQLLAVPESKLESRIPRVIVGTARLGSVVPDALVSPSDRA